VEISILFLNFDDNTWLYFPSATVLIEPPYRLTVVLKTFVADNVEYYLKLVLTMIIEIDGKYSKCSC
jgi:hypothetical protein